MTAPYVRPTMASSAFAQNQEHGGSRAPLPDSAPPLLPGPARGRQPSELSPAPIPDSAPPSLFDAVPGHLPSTSFSAPLPGGARSSTSSVVQAHDLLWEQSWYNLDRDVSLRRYIGLLCDFSIMEWTGRHNARHERQCASTIHVCKAF